MRPPRRPGTLIGGVFNTFHMQVVFAEYRASSVATGVGSRWGMGATSGGVITAGSGTGAEAGVHRRSRCCNA